MPTGGMEMKNLINQISKSWTRGFSQRTNPKDQLNELFEQIKASELHQGAPNGVYRTETWVYEAILKIPQPGEVTLETGAGASSLCFARSQGQSHHVLTPDKKDIELIQQFSVTHSLDISKLIFHNKSSADVLPTFNEPLAMVLVDGCHGPFIPFLDFYYGVKNLVKGGYVLIDDIHLFFPKMLFEAVQRERAVEVVHKSQRAVLLRITNNAFIDYDWWQTGLAYQWEGELITDDLLSQAEDFRLDQ